MVDWIWESLLTNWTGVMFFEGRMPTRWNHEQHMMKLDQSKPRRSKDRVKVSDYILPASYPGAFISIKMSWVNPVSYMQINCPIIPRAVISCIYQTRSNEAESWWELMRVEKREFAREFVNSQMLRSNEDESWWVCILYCFAEPATTKCKPPALLQLSSTLMTGQTRTNSYQL